MLFTPTTMLDVAGTARVNVLQIDGGADLSENFDVDDRAKPGMVVAIEPGDMLTTSNTPGHAMKVADYPRAQGAIIGKAMTTLAQGDMGLVLVLVNLQ